MGVSGLRSGYPLDHEDPSEDCLSNFIEFVDWIRRFRFWACRVAGMCLCRIRAAMRAGFGFRLQHQSSNHFHGDPQSFHPTAAALSLEHEY